jgi:FkbM family methyltransferase
MEVTTALFEHDGCRFTVREGTNDRDVIRSIFQGEYAVPDHTKPPPYLASIDVGAHIGAFSVWACNVYDRHSVLAIEPLPENVALIMNHAAQNQANIHVLAGAAGSILVPTVEIGYNCEEDESGRMHHFIGNAMGVKRGGKSFIAPRFTLRDMFQRLESTIANDQVWTLKLDAENAEYPLIAEADLTDLRRCKWIIGEFHDQGEGPLWNKIQQAGFRRHDAVSGHFCYERQ